MTEDQKRFFSRIDSLRTGERAAFRRETGVMLRQAGGSAITAFYRCLSAGVPRWQEDRWFAVACLRCLWDPGVETGKPLEQVLAGLIRADELSDSTKHRVELLLDTEWDDDGYMLIKLTRLVKLIRQKSDRAQLDFASLLNDLCCWDSQNQSVQRKWARAIFSAVDEKEANEKES